jgi:hypothetical protein
MNMKSLENATVGFKRLLLISLSGALLFPLVGPTLQKSAYAHTFSSDESASFLALIEEIRIEAHLAMNNTSLGTLAQQHASRASDLLDVNVTREIKERNDRIGTELPISLRDLEGLTASSLVDVQAIRQKVDQIDSLLGEAVSVRIDREHLDNATTSALSFALLVNSLSDHYGKAIEREIAQNTTEGVSEPLEQTTGSGSNKIRVSWSPTEIMANRSNTFFLEFYDARADQLRNGSTMYAFMFMPASDPEVMIIHRQPEYATDGKDKQTFTFREGHVGPNTIRLTWINGFEREMVDFPITVLPPANGTGTISSPSQNASGNIVNIAEYETAQALAARLEVLFADMKGSAPANSTELVGKVELGLQQLRSAIDQKAPIDDVEIVIHSQIHPNLQSIYDLHVIPEFTYPVVAGVLALGGVIAVRLGHSGKDGRL